jgi:hypothetical protein
LGEDSAYRIGSEGYNGMNIVNLEGELYVTIQKARNMLICISFLTEALSTCSTVEIDNLH